MKKKKYRVGAVLLIVLMGGIAYFAMRSRYEVHFRKIAMDVDQKTIYIPTGSRLEDVADLLAQHHILDQQLFLRTAEQLNYTDAKVEPGKYSVSNGMKVKALIYGLKNGNQELKDVRIAFHHCRSTAEMAGRVARTIEADSSALIDYIHRPSTLLHYGLNKATVMTMFLPDTYEVGEWDTSPEEFVAFMARQFSAFWQDEKNDREAKLRQLQLNRSEVITLASIIESEQGIFQQEWKTIAGLYLNRVRKHWKLESDPTAKYCWGEELDGVQRLLNKHMKKDCPYNTYLHPGLPPGPICIPSKGAIDAVLNADRHDYFFMCARPDNSGLHRFSHTLNEHRRNARLFWKYMNERGK